MEDALMTASDDKGVNSFVKMETNKIKTIRIRTPFCNSTAVILVITSLFILRFFNICLDNPWFSILLYSFKLDWNTTTKLNLDQGEPK